MLEAANRLHHISMLYAGFITELALGQKVGMIPASRPGVKEVRDLVDLVLITRAEINGLTRLLIASKLITEGEAIQTFDQEYDWLAKAKAKQFGCEVKDTGLVFKTEPT